MTTPDEDQFLWEKRHWVKYGAELSALYHRKRERFYDLLDKLTKALAIAFSSAAVAAIMNPLWVQVFGSFVAISTTIGLVFGFAEKARRHSDLAAQFVRLEAEIAARGERDFEEDDLSRWEGRLREIEAAEPPTLGALVRLCQNQIARAHGDYEAVCPLSWWERLTVHLKDHPGGPSRNATG